jgi:hypothetical protein
MKYIAEFGVLLVEPDAPKGEELDKEVESALQSMDIEGCEVADDVQLRRKDEAAPGGKLEMFARFAKEIRRTIIRDMDAPWEGNAQYTNRQMVEFWCDEMLKRGAK